jgi:hypothetical protein
VTLGAILWAPRIVPRARSALGGGGAPLDFIGPVGLLSGQQRLAWSLSTRLALGVVVLRDMVPMYSNRLEGRAVERRRAHLPWRRSSARGPGRARRSRPARYLGVGSVAGRSWPPYPGRPARHLRLDRGIGRGLPGAGSLGGASPGLDGISCSLVSSSPAGAQAAPRSGWPPRRRRPGRGEASASVVSAGAVPASLAPKPSPWAASWGASLAAGCA